MCRRRHVIASPHRLFQRMKRLAPLLISAIGGFVLIAAFFIPAGQGAGEVVAVWFDILASIAFILGGGNLLKVHLKKISDRAAGWGYSGVTLLAFLVTLWLGLFKVGVPPAPNTEFYGETFAAVPLEELPEFSVPGVIPPRGDGKPLPASVRTQLHAENGALKFRGWMMPTQAGDLSAYQDTLAWQAAVETLAELAQPPEALRGKLSYHADHQVLGFQGVMSDADRATLETIFSGKPRALAAIGDAQTRSQMATALETTTVPAGFAVPASQQDRLSVAGSTMTLLGPMSESMRAAAGGVWPNYARLRPLAVQERAEFQQQLESRGTALSEGQLTVLETQYNAVWTADQLIAALNSAGVPSGSRKTARQLLAERDSGETNLNPVIPAGPSVQLNAAQEEAVRRFAADSSAAADDLVQELRAGGDITDQQAGVVEEYLASQPTVGRWKRDVAMDLLKRRRNHPEEPQLTTEQLDWLLTDAQAEHTWTEAVDRLFAASHRAKYPWSGEYLASGSGLHWIYEYTFKPLTSTMFALLAFYVASAAFRAFRAKNLEAILLLGTAFIILIAQTPIGAWLTSGIPDSLSALQADELKRYIMSLFNTAGNRAIMIGIALGTAATSLKILLGVDRSYLGSGDE